MSLSCVAVFSRGCCGVVASAGPRDRSWVGSGSGLHRVGVGHNSVVALAHYAHRHGMIPLHQREIPRISLSRVAGSSRPPDPEDRSWFGSGSGLHRPVIGHYLVVPLQGLVRSEGRFAIGSFSFAWIDISIPYTCFARSCHHRLKLTDILVDQLSTGGRFVLRVAD